MQILALVLYAGVFAYLCLPPNGPYFGSIQPPQNHTSPPSASPAQCAALCYTSRVLGSPERHLPRWMGPLSLSHRLLRYHSAINHPFRVSLVAPARSTLTLLTLHHDGARSDAKAIAFSQAVTQKRMTLQRRQRGRQDRIHCHVLHPAVRNY